jgi:hypothetical protein
MGENRSHVHEDTRRKGKEKKRGERGKEKEGNDKN